MAIMYTRTAAVYSIESAARVGWFDNKMLHHPILVPKGELEIV